ncbi:DUF11 domain-containing protein [Anabaena sp. FACHB-709]|uniref:DUF11 domain-containing protein n=1 Tax=Trichormus variabilis NIES-23 TaxID=1973479 RepID=A0A1Z4KIZ9_ANAVA|nr:MULTISPECIES: DUF11 domain-containing protein [Nostocaceae]RUR89364.1 hypothetical protein DSM107007_00500 [Nostoc sp. PCC 7120 = FACHB-418]BAB74987.1 all3288 [Nostoc sp. PCC 7120 = FACHB-418]BAY68917.1 hypothetical protein NIES23_17070 [Trichormus variabilis NIES-23]
MNRSPTNQKTSKNIQNIKSFSRIAALCVGIVAIGIQPVQAEGSRNLYPASSPGTAYRANLEWRTEQTGNLITRRTLLKVYAQAGEYILLGSSAVGVTRTSNNVTTTGDIYVYNPNLVTGQVGSETFPSTPSFQCTSQTGGKINSRTEELAGPRSINGTGNTSGYTPCYYQAPSTGIYDVVIFGPAGFNASGDGGITAEINLTSSTNFDSSQGSSVAAWDVTVRSSTSSTTDSTGRLFSYYLALFTGGNGRPVYSNVYPVTTDGYRYRTEIRGLDPNGFVLYGNEVGFFDSDGVSTLYRNVVGTNGNVSNIQGGASLARPQFPTFFNLLDPNALAFINRYDRFGSFQGVGITTNPIPPSVTNPNFTGNLSGNNSKVGNGGTFSFNSTVTGTYEIVIRGDGSTDFDPKNPQNRVLRGYMNSSGTQNVSWDGRNNAGNFFPVGTNYLFNIRINAGEYHFPVLDAENNFSGGPTVTLLNPPASYPTDLPGFGPTTGFYDDRVYRTKNGTIVHVGATQANIDNNAPLCGVGPTVPAFSNQITGFDTRTNQRAFGQASGGNTNTVCTGSFGDTKGLDQWTFFPSNAANNFLNIVSPDLTVSKTHTPTDFVRGSTGTYVINVPNSGGDVTDGTPVTVTDILPTGIIPTAATGNGWTCTISGQTVTCSRSDVLNPGANYPNININVTIDSGITATSVTNTATVSGGGDGDNTNNTSPPDIANIITPPDLSMNKTHTGNFNQGDTGQIYTLIVSNASGAGATDGNTVTVTDNLPTGLTPTAVSGTGWNCSISGQTVTCSRSDVLNPGGSYPAITLTVDVANNAPSTLINIAIVNGGGDITPGNNTDDDQTNITGNNNTPNLILVKRITRVNNQDLTDIVDGMSNVATTATNYVAAPRDTDDNDAKWPVGYLRGLINAGTVKLGDELEYTIYFLSNGQDNATKVQLCDLVPNNVDFLAAAFNGLSPNDGGLTGSDQGIAMAVGSTIPTVYFSNVADSDRATFYPANDPNTPSVCNNTGSNTNGALVVEITRNLILPNLPPATSSGNPAESYGFVRFRGKVK